MTASVTLKGAGVRFDFDRQQRVVTPGLARLRRRGRSAWGVHDVDVRIAAGEGVALVGPSGSGKTSLLRLLAGILPCDAGSVTIEGRVGSLLAVEGGLLGPLTGRENALTLSVLAGLDRARAQAELDGLRERSRLGDAFERPVASYSEGMRARLGFSIASAARPDVLLLDEVFEALDHEYRAVVEEYTQELMGRGGVVVAAGHDHDALERICGRALAMRDGEVVDDGPAAEVVAGYRRGGATEDAPFAAGARGA